MTLKTPMGRFGLPMAVSSSGAAAPSTLGLTPTQIHLTLNEITEAARAIQRLTIQASEEDGQDSDPRDVEARFIALGALADRIGLIADRAGAALGSPYATGPKPEPELWMMPPAWWPDDDEEFTVR